jgi:uncharacterized protein
VFPLICHAATIEVDHTEEERFVTIGKNALERILVVVFTWRGEVIRIISARKPKKLERQTDEG